ncbi:MAG: protein-L-isoaspartate(D-aspartate) O-methyltransferase [Gammaproteobacteria bacterium]
MKRNFQGIGMTSQRSRDRLVEQLRQQGIQSEAVLDAIRNTPRHIFVDEALATRAYDNTALPIGNKQTISQPYIVARMTEALLQQDKLQRVLEIGTGCGYQTAILAQLLPEVYSIERIDALLGKARSRLRDLQYRNINLKHGDGRLGWPEQAPFDGILVTAAPTDMPEALTEQLSVGGRLIIPIGEAGEQELLCVSRNEDGLTEEHLDQVSFVRLADGRG